MNAELLMQVKALDPAPADAELPTGMAAADVVLAAIDERNRTVQTKDRIDMKRPTPRRRWAPALVALAAFAAVLAAGVVIWLIGGFDDNVVESTTTSTTTTTQLTTTTQAPTTTSTTSTSSTTAAPEAAPYESLAWGPKAPGVTYGTSRLLVPVTIEGREGWLSGFEESELFMMFGTKTEERNPNSFVQGVYLLATRTGDPVDVVVADIFADEVFANVEELAPVTVDGRSARVLRAQGLGDDRYRIIRSVSGADRGGFGTLGFTEQFLILEVDGQTLIIWILAEPDREFAAFEAEAYAFLRTLRFVDQDG